MEKLLPAQSAVNGLRLAPESGGAETGVEPSLKKESSWLFGPGVVTPDMMFWPFCDRRWMNQFYNQLEIESEASCVSNTLIVFSSTPRSRASAALRSESGYGP